MADIKSPSVNDGDEVQQVPSTAQGDISKSVDDHALDEAAKYLANTEEYAPMTPEQEKKIVKKIDAWMIPLLLFAASLGAVDKVQIGTASLYGFQTDNNMVGQEYSWLGSILPLGTLIGLVPASYLVQRVPPGKLLCTASLMWSILTIMYAPCRSWSGFMALRFWLGFLEAAITPSLTMLVASFYKKNEQPPRNAIIFAYFSSVFNGFFAWVVGTIPASAPLLKWQYLYIMTGSINVIYSIFLFFFLPDSPMNARFLTAEQKFHAVQRLAGNRTGIANRVWKWDQVWEALLDIRIWIIFFFNIVINIPNGGLQTFGSIIISNLGFSALEASLLTMPFGIIATGGAWLFSYIAARSHNKRTFVASIALLLPIFGTALVYGLPRSNIAGQMVGLYFMYFYWPPYVVGISLPQANTAGHTKKSVTYSLVTVGYAAGNLIGPQTFRANQAPKYTSGVVVMLVCYCVCMLLLGLYWFIATQENKRRDCKYGKPEVVQEGTAEGFIDMTDKKQHNFRYTT
ncbi:major facilitator superfamily domain-containing protein [Pseudomassariella vexata]|uniref:Major facilitator superfamily domain-containing protein n=1 Tax=Pseudomassariella vexata TaxID=1141098 RepID=A0A1Y2DX17_9PEZI|nr:major facilitator superfamily domain-containing protein [Pseudomassariella vexata]ORY63838.1 major facilitator superfamily domain-containing protein [Pseudomassariella vexata]